MTRSTQTQPDSAADGWRRVVLENALDAVIGVDDHDTIVDWNRQAEVTFGWTKDQALGRQMAELIVPPESREMHSRGIAHFLRTGEGPILNRRVELEALHQNGSRFPIELTVIPIPSGGTFLFYSFVRDISVLKRVTAELKLKSEALENSLNAFDIVNARGEFIYANRAYLKMWGYETLEEILGTSPGGHCADPEVPIKIIGELKARGECETEFVARRKDGSTFDVHMWARLAHDSKGDEIYPTTAIDITERKKAESALQEAVRARDEFISICSHELKTPLTSMKLQFQMAARQLESKDTALSDPSAMERRIVSANRQLDRMTNLIEEMLDVSRIATGKLQIRPESLDLIELVREVMERFSDQFAATGFPIRFEPGLAKVPVEADRYRIEQVVSNLLANALKYGGGKPVTISIEATEQMARLSVKDQGIGIGSENLSRIFERFERAIPADNISGLGLGLYISKQIVQAHGGRIWAESHPGQGSAFRVELPLRPSS